jgi:hypothetical protein
MNINDNPRKVCRYCGSFADIIPELRPRDWHDSARCVEGEEPIR